MKDKIYSVVLIILSVVLCKQCASDYMKGGDNRAISNYEKMIFDNSKTKALIYPEYKETTIKVLGVETKSYEFRYYFSINEEKYEGQYNTILNKDSIIKNPILDVYYLKTDPNFNCVNPETLLAEEKEKNSSKKDLYFAIFWGVSGLFTTLSFISSLRKKDTDKNTTA